MSSFVVKTLFRGKDEVSPNFKKMGKSANKFGRKADKAFKKSSKSAKVFKGVLAGILTAGLLKTGFGFLNRGLKTATAQFISFDQSITSASAKFKDLDLSTKKGQKTLLDLKKTARDVGAATQFSATEAAQGMDFLALAGFTTKQAMKALPSVVDLATVGNLDLGRATDIASDSLGAFGLASEDSVQLQKNLIRVNDVLAKTTASTNTNMEDMFEAIKGGAPTFTSTGQSLETFAALTGVMANAGIKGSVTATTLKNTMLSLAKPSDEARKVLDFLNVSIKNQQGGFRDALDILDDFKKGLGKLTQTQKANALVTVFGKRSITGLSVVLDGGVDKVRKFRGQLQKAKGDSKSMADIMRGSLENRIKSMQSAAIELGFKFIEAFEGNGASAIERMTTAIRGFDMQPVTDGIKAGVKVFGELFESIKPVLKEGFVKLQEAFEIIKPILPDIWEGIKTGVGLFGKLFGALSPLVPLFAKGLVGAFRILKPLAKGLFKIFESGIGFIAKAVEFIIPKIEKLITKITDVGKAFTEKISKSFIGKAAGAISSFTEGLFGGPKKVELPKLVLPKPELPADIIKEARKSRLRVDANLSGQQREELGFKPPAEIVPPNRTDIAAKQQQMRLTGLIKLAGAPPGTEFTTDTTGPAEITPETLGKNP